MTVHQRVPGPQAVPGKAFLHQVRVYKGEIIPNRVGHSLVGENPLLLGQVHSEGIFKEFQGLEIEGRPGVPGGTLQENGTVGMLVGAKVAIERMGQQNPSSMNEIPRPDKDRQRVPLHKVAGRNGVS
jgi:hypothetical protein